MSSASPVLTQALRPVWCALFAAAACSLPLGACLDDRYGQDGCYRNDDGACELFDSGTANPSPDAGGPSDAGQDAGEEPEDDAGCTPRLPKPSFDATAHAQFVRPIGGRNDQAATWSEGAQRLCYALQPDAGASIFECVPRKSQMFDAADVRQTLVSFPVAAIADDLEQSFDGELLYFSMKPSRAGGVFQLYVSRRQGADFGPGFEWVDAGFPGEDVTDPDLSSDGRELFVTVGTAPPRLYRLTRRSADRPWSPPQPLPAPVRSAQGERSSSISANGQFLIFESARPVVGADAGPGAFRLHIAERDCSGTWSQPEPLDLPVDPSGAGINGPQNPEWAYDGGIIFDHSEDGEPWKADLYYAPPLP